MPKATDTHTTSRRPLFRGAAALLGAACLLPASLSATSAAPPSAPSGAAGDDAELIRLCELFHRQHAFALSIPDDDDGASGEAMDERWATSDAIEDMRPMTPEGARAKAAVALFLLVENRGNEPNSGDTRFAVATLRHLMEG